MGNGFFMSIQKFLEYILIEKKYSSLTAVSYKKDLNDFQAFLLKTEAEDDLASVEKRQIKNYIINLSENNLVPASINRKLSTLRSFYKFLLKTEKIKIDPTASISNLKKEKKKLIPFTEKEMRQMEEEFDKENLINENSEFEKKRNKLIFDILYQTGIRRAELINLEQNKIDLLANTLNVIGKRNKERQIPITQALKKQIEDYILTKQKELENKSVTLLCDLKGQKLKEKFVYNLINVYLSAVTTKEKKSPHMLRHTFATQLLNNGAEINSIKEILGHSSLSATQIYVHSNIENLKKVFNHSHPRGNTKNEEYEN